MKNSINVKKRGGEPISRSTPPQIVVNRTPPRSLPDLPNTTAQIEGLSPQRETSPAIRSDDSLFGTAGSSFKEEISVEKLVAEGDLAQLKIFLLEKGVENIVSYIENERFGKDATSLLHIAVMNAQAHIIRYFRQLGVSLELYNIRKETPLHLAVRYLPLMKETVATIEELFKFDNASNVFDKRDWMAKSARDYAYFMRRKKFFVSIEESASFSKLEEFLENVENTEGFYECFYEEEAPLLLGVREAKQKYKAKQEQEQREKVDVSRKIHPYVLGN